MRILPGILAAAVVSFAGCTLTPNLNNDVQLTISTDLPHAKQGRTPRRSSASFLPFADSGSFHGLVQAPASGSDMDCLMVNVIGQGIAPPFTTSPGSPIPWDCLNIGVTSSIAANTISTGTTPTVTVNVPANEVLQIQILGVVTGQGPTACAGMQLDQLLGNTQVALFDMGESAAGPFTVNNQQVAITDDYDYTPTSPLSPSNYQNNQEPDLIESCVQLPQPYEPVYFYYGDTVPSAPASPITANPPNGTLPPLSNGNSFVQCLDGDSHCFDSASGVSDLPVWASSPNLAARIDLLFPIDGYPMAEYNYLTLSLIMDEGFLPMNGGNCAPLTNNQSNETTNAVDTGATGFQAAVYSNQDAGWFSNQVQGNPGVGQEYFVNPTLTNLMINYTGTTAPIIGFPLAESGDGIPAGHYVHVTVQSLDVGDGATQCAFLQVIGAQIFLDHVAQPPPIVNL